MLAFSMVNYSAIADYTVLDICAINVSGAHLSNGQTGSGTLQQTMLRVLLVLLTATAATSALAQSEEPQAIESETGGLEPKSLRRGGGGWQSKSLSRSGLIICCFFLPYRGITSPLGSLGVP